MNREELIKLVDQIKTSSGTEKEVDRLLERFMNSVPDPIASDYIFAREYEHLTLEQIVDKALSYKSFLL
jgi:hypothetical protein